MIAAIGSFFITNGEKLQYVTIVFFFKNSGKVFALKKDPSKKNADFISNATFSPEAKTFTNFFDEISFIRIHEVKAQEVKISEILLK